MLLIRRSVRAALSLCVVVFSGDEGWGDEWRQFRGPAGRGTADSVQLPSEWSADKDSDAKNIAWKVALPGTGWSQPVVWGDKIFVTTAITENQRKPRPGFGGFGGGGPRGGGIGPEGGPRGDRPDADRPRSKRPDSSEGKDGDKGAPDRKEGKGPGGKQGERPSDKDDRPRGGPGRGPGGGFGRGGFGRTPEPPDAIYQWKVLCLDSKTGSVVWEQLAHQGRPTIATHGSNTYASETPITDGERLYAYFGMTGLYCYDLAGKPLWKKELGSHPMIMGWGTGSSPALDGGRLFIQCDNEQKSFLAALDAKTGDELWRVARDEKSNWSTPYVWKNKKRTEVVVSGSKKIRSYDPANGSVLWELRTSGQCSASPVGDEEFLYVGTGGGFAGRGPLRAIRAGAEGELALADGETSNAGIAWEVQRAGAEMASPLLYQSCLYILSQRGGMLSCYDAKTGKQHYRERLPSARGFTSSPWGADGKVFCLDEEGRTFVVEAGPKLKVVSTNKLDDMFWSSVAVVGNKLLIRGVNHLYCIAK